VIIKHYLVSGKVQGVFYRASTTKQAIELGLTGTVQNLADGRVEVYLRGEVDTVEAMYRWLLVGSPLAAVDAVTEIPVCNDGTDLVFAELFTVLRA
jgi:acylphosphatase